MAHEDLLPTSNGSSTEDSPRDGSPKPELASSGKVGSSIFANQRDDISLRHADIPVCLCSFVSGLCDSITFNASSVFGSMQTGNTIFLALGTTQLPSNTPWMWLRALCSIIAFQLGVFCFGQTRHFRPKAKSTLGASFLVQALLVWIAAALAQGGVARPFANLSVADHLHHEQVMDWAILGPIILLAFQFGGQIVCSRQLGFNEVPTNVVTSVYCDIFNDPNLFAPPWENPKRNRRVSTVILMLVGAILGAGLSRASTTENAPIMSVGLWIAGLIKFGIAMAWFAWKADDTDNLGNEKK